jgi:hypothetical protein
LERREELTQQKQSGPQQLKSVKAIAPCLKESTASSLHRLERDDGRAAALLSARLPHLSRAALPPLFLHVTVE